MRQKINKEARQSLKLPSIGNKTMGDMYKQSGKQKQRPMSSKNTVSDLEKKLFTQLQTFDQKSMTCKTQKPLSKKQNKKNTAVTLNSCKDIVGNGKNSQTDSMQKIAQLMPQLYSKIIQSKKYDEVKPLKETFMFINQENTPKQGSSQHKSFQMKKTMKNEKVATLHAKGSCKIKQVKQAKLEQQKTVQKQVKDSFDFAQSQMDKIYQQYLQMQGLSQPETSISELAEINRDLGKCEVDIEQLQKNYGNLIKQLSDLCINEPQ